MTGPHPDSGPAEGWALENRQTGWQNTSFITSDRGPADSAEYGWCAVSMGLLELSPEWNKLTRPAMGRTRKPRGLPVSGAAGKHSGRRKGCWGEWVPTGGAGPCVLPASCQQFHVDREEDQSAAPAQFLPQQRKHQGWATTVPIIFRTSIQTALLVA